MNPHPSRFFTGLTISLRDNTSAYGYSVAITGSYALLNSLSGGASVSDVFAAALGAVAAFTIIQAFGLRLLGASDGRASDRVRLVARMMDLISVGAALGCALACGRFLSGPGAWFAGTFFASCVFVFLDALELSVVKSKID